jgi:phage terminase large subunit-like protein
MTIPRVVPAWQKFSESVMEKRVTHDGNVVLARHMENTVLKRDARGIRPVKESKSSRRHIDLAICAVFAHDRAVSRIQHGPTREWFGAWA